MLQKGVFIHLHPGSCPKCDKVAYEKSFTQCCVQFLINTNSLFGNNYHLHLVYISCEIPPVNY